MTLSYVIETFTRVGAGINKTLELFILTLIVSLPLGFIVTLMLRSKIKPLKFIAEFFVYILRSTPLVLQLLFIYFGLPLLPWVGKYLILDRFPAAIIGFILNYAAYFAEIFRGGLLAVDQGQHEAAKVLGLTKFQTTMRIVIPQMLRVSLPALSNETITLLKDTSLMFTLAIPEVLQFAKSAVSATGKTFPFIVAGVIYLALNTVIAWILKKTEKHFEF